jgi:biofilm PGA synthesis N-glycosyltransferase PgaC
MIIEQKHDSNLSLIFQPDGKALNPSCSSRSSLTVIIPAYNEEATIAETVASLLQQTRRPDRVLVVDDGSTDGTAAAAREAGAEVLTPPRNTGSKAGAQSFALQFVDTDLTLAIDADTILAPDAIEKLLVAMQDPAVAAASGVVLPRHVSTLWERGRFVEYLLTFGFYKPVQDYYGRSLISSGCFSVYRTDALRQIGGWSTRTLAEDMDLTWTFYRLGRKVKFVRDAVSYPIEPHDFRFMRKQLKRWSHGFVQNVLLHGPAMMRDRTLSTFVFTAVIDALSAPLVYWLALPALAVAWSPWFLAGYVFDLPVLALPVLVEGASRGALKRSITSLPAFLVLRQVNTAFMAIAFWNEIVLQRSFKVYEKGH